MSCLNSYHILKGSWEKLSSQIIENNYNKFSWCTATLNEQQDWEKSAAGKESKHLQSIQHQSLTVFTFLCIAQIVCDFHDIHNCKRGKFLLVLRLLGCRCYRHTVLVSLLSPKKDPKWEKRINAIWHSYLIFILWYEKSLKTDYLWSRSSCKNH